MKLSKALAILSSLSVGSPIIAADNDNQVIDACAEYDQSYLGAETKLEYCEMGYNDGKEAGYEIGYEAGKEEEYDAGYNAGKASCPTNAPIITADKNDSPFTDVSYVDNPAEILIPYHVGYDAGQEEGYTEGYNTAKEEGYYDAGYDAGKASCSTNAPVTNAPTMAPITAAPVATFTCNLKSDRTYESCHECWGGWLASHCPPIGDNSANWDTCNKKCAVDCAMTEDGSSCEP